MGASAGCERFRRETGGADAHVGARLQMHLDGIEPQGVCRRFGQPIKNETPAFSFRCADVGVGAPGSISYIPIGNVPADRRRCFTIAMGSLLECGALLEVLRRRRVADAIRCRNGRLNLIRLAGMLARLAEPASPSLIHCSVRGATELIAPRRNVADVVEDAKRCAEFHREAINIQSFAGKKWCDLR